MTRATALRRFVESGYLVLSSCVSAENLSEIDAMVVLATIETRLSRRVEVGGDQIVVVE